MCDRDEAGINTKQSTPQRQSGDCLKKTNLKSSNENFQDYSVINQES